MPDGVPDNNSRETPKFSEKDGRELFIAQFCQRNNCEIIEPKKRTLSSDDDQLSPKKVQIHLVLNLVLNLAFFKLKFDENESGEEDEAAETKIEVKEEFVPGWVKREADCTDEDGISNKGLPSRNKWQTGVVAFAHDAYQPQETKTGAFTKLKTTLKKKKS